MSAWQTAWRFFLSYSLLFGLSLALLVGISAPAAGKWVGSLPIDLPNTYIVLVFFTSGISLKTTELRDAVAFPKGLLLGLALILFVTPLLGLAYMQLSGSLPYQEFVIGLATFAVMPTTVAASVVIVGLAKGNTGLALVLSVATNIIGVVTVPFILKFVIGAGDDMKPFKLLLQLFLTILVPVVCGKLASFWPPVLAFAQRFALEIKLFTSFFLAVIPWIKISQAEKSIAHVTVASAMVLIALSVLMHIIFLLFNYAVCAIAGLPPADFCAVVITSSQKTLATGAAVVASLPPSLGVQGLIILPFIFAQFAQVVIDAFMVPFWKRRTLHADECAAVAASEADAVLAEAHDIPVEIEAASSPNSTKERTPLVARAPKPSVDISPLLHSTEATDVFVSSVRSPAQLRSPHYRGAGTPASGTAVTALQA